MPKGNFNTVRPLKNPERHQYLIDKYLTKRSGWKVKLVYPEPETWAAETDWKTKTIRVGCKTYASRHFPVIFLHEVGHIALRHDLTGPPNWRDEYEAERWAHDEIYAYIRDYNWFAWPTGYKAERKGVIADHIAHADESERPHEEKILRWVYGHKNWRTYA